MSRTNEEIAADSAKEFTKYTRQEDCTLERLTAIILAALNESTAQRDAEIARLRRGLVMIAGSCDNCTNGDDMRALAAQILGGTEDKNPMVFHSEYYNCERFTRLEQDRAHLRAALDVAREALEAMIHKEPATLNGECFYPMHDGDGEYIGEQQVDPLALLGDVMTDARQALARIDELTKSNNE